MCVGKYCTNRRACGWVGKYVVWAAGVGPLAAAASVRNVPSAGGRPGLTPRDPMTLGGASRFDPLVIFLYSRLPRVAEAGFLQPSARPVGAQLGVQGPPPPYRFSPAWQRARDGPLSLSLARALFLSRGTGETRHRTRRASKHGQRDEGQEKESMLCMQLPFPGLLAASRTNTSWRTGGLVHLDTSPCSSRKRPASKQELWGRVGW